MERLGVFVEYLRRCQRGGKEGYVGCDLHVGSVESVESRRVLKIDHQES